MVLAGTTISVVVLSCWLIQIVRDELELEPDRMKVWLGWVLGSAFNNSLVLRFMSWELHSAGTSFSLFYSIFFEFFPVYMLL